MPLRRRITLFPLVGALYFMVSGGPYGLEELVQKTGFGLSIVLLLVTPLLWSLPTALMVGELSAALPEDGGYYIWVRRALGPFWGYQGAWLSLAASVFDMAIYPTLFVLYLQRLWPAMAAPPYPIAISVAFIGACALWNMAGARAVGDGSALMTVLLTAPFVLLALLGVLRPGLAPRAPATAPHLSLTDASSGVLVAMWNYMGWDNVSTVAGEVARPQRTYPLAVLLATALIATAYMIPVSAMWYAGIDPSSWETGSWVDVAREFGGAALAIAVVVGGMLSALGMFNALCLSYSRLPVVLAEDGYLPAVCTRRFRSNDAPWVAILLCSALWTASLGLSFRRLASLDILLYGTSLVLEFIAFVALRVREPSLARPFKVPGGLPGALLLCVGPILLLGFALIDNAHEKVGSMNALAFGAAVVVAGPLLYTVTRWHTVLRRAR
ncbi:APC family permease [Pendulispora albinea]|uniref:APC family permease n=1 Tax=Pendulispora albinea TaxID=2741071 RepID=A0ABZ2LZ56_9BACT